MIPPITWAQTTDHILLKINVRNVTNLNLNFNNNSLYIKCKSSNIDYNFNELLYSNIDKDMVTHTYQIFDSYIDCKIKKNDDTEWLFLIKNHNKHRAHIKVDWSRWCNEDDEPSTNDDIQTMIDNMNIDTDYLDKSCTEHNLNGIQSGESTPCSSDDDIFE